MTDTATNARQHEEQIERIRANPDLNEGAKRRQEADPLNMDVLASVVGPQRPPELGRN